MMERHLGRLISLVFLCSVWCNHLYSQVSENPKEIFLEAESYFLYEEYNEALPLYQKLKDKFSDNYNLDYRIGRCYLNIPYELQKSVACLETAVKHISLTYAESDLKEIHSPIDSWYYLGDAYRVTNQLEKAIYSYKKFKELTTNKDYDFFLVDHQIRACERAVLMRRNPVDMEEKNLGSPVNTRFSETNPVFSANEDMIVYAERLPFYQAMFYSRKVDGKWTTPVNMIPELGVDGDCYPTSLSADGRELYIYRSDEFQGDIYVSNYKDGRWSKIRKLNKNINTKYWESHASVSSDGKTLYFTSNRKGGFGALDIYRSTRMSVQSDDWGEPQNLGPVVNSEYNEDTPFITPDGKRLYFSSFGHETMGGYDVFYSDLTDNGVWMEPVNAGFPINTTFDDLFFNPGGDGTFAYTAKFDPNGYGKYDIIRYELYSDKRPRRFMVDNPKLNESADPGLAINYLPLQTDSVETFVKNIANNNGDNRNRNLQSGVKTEQKKNDPVYTMVQKKWKEKSICRSYGPYVSHVQYTMVICRDYFAIVYFAMVKKKNKHQKIR